MARPADCSPRSRCQTYRRCSDLDRQERDPDMSVQPRRSLLRTRTMCAAFLVFAAAALIPQVAAAGNTTICHVPPGNEANAHLITVSENAVPAHLSHGDFVAISCACTATEGASCGANQAPCCAGLKCVADVTGTFSCVAGTSSNTLPQGSACTASSQCDPLYPCNFYGPGDGVCGGGRFLLPRGADRESTPLNSSHSQKSYSGFCL